MELKVCESCHVEKPLSDFYFRNGRNTYHNRCKRCCIDGIKVVREERTSKVCKHCGVEKPFSEYQKAGGGKWLQPYCKPCDSVRKNKHYKDNIDKYKERGAEYYESNKEAYAEYSKKRYQEKKPEITKQSKEYRDKNKDKIKERGLAYHHKNRDRILKKHKEYYENNKERFTAYWHEKIKSNPDKLKEKSLKDKEYREKNQDRVKQNRLKYKEAGREKSRVWSNVKSATDPIFKIKKNLRTRIRFALKRWNTKKFDNTQNLLGCTIDQFKVYFESLFTDGMNWDKFMSGEIWIDHIKPCVLFDLTKEDQQRECFNYKNLQPLWKIDNLKKGISYKKEDHERN